jgi:hypothetical protein
MLSIARIQPGIELPAVFTPGVGLVRKPDLPAIADIDLIFAATLWSYLYQIQFSPLSCFPRPLSRPMLRKSLIALSLMRHMLTM